MILPTTSHFHPHFLSSLTAGGRRINACLYPYICAYMEEKSSLNLNLALDLCANVNRARQQHTYQTHTRLDKAAPATSGKMENALWVIELSVVVGLSPWLTSSDVLWDDYDGLWLLLYFSFYGLYAFGQTLKCYYIADDVSLWSCRDNLNWLSIRMDTIWLKGIYLRAAMILWVSFLIS